MDHNLIETEEELVLIQLLLQLIDRLGVMATVLCGVLRLLYNGRGHRVEVIGDFNHNQYRVDHINRLVMDSDLVCVEQLRVDRRCFKILCDMVENIGGLPATKWVSIEEKVAMFLSVLAHDKKNRVVSFDFKRSGHTVSIYFRAVLGAVLRLQSLLLVKPEPITETEMEPRWNIFQNCLGALDGTHVNVRVKKADSGRYRNRKGVLSTNVLGVCDRNMNIIFVLPGWEGSAADGRILKDVVTRENGLRVPTGCYYLVDVGYTNGEGFLAPYRGRRYHLEEWEGNTPVNKEEYFNMKHSRARNIIERCFGLLKIRWAALTKANYYPIRVQGRIIIACCLIHNLIRQEMAIDPMEDEIPEDHVEDLDHHDLDVDYVDHVESTPQWTAWRDTVAHHMYNDWRVQRGLEPLE